MQSRISSLIESVANIVIGFIFALAGQLIIFPVVGVDTAMGQNLSIALFFTALSLARSYLLRRYFNHRLKRWLHIQQKEK